MVKIIDAVLYAVEIKRIRVSELNKEPSMNCTTDSFMSLHTKSEFPRKLNVEPGLNSENKALPAVSTPVL